MDPPPLFVSVASKGVSLDISPLFAILAEERISVAAKGLNERVGGPDRVGISAPRRCLERKAGANYRAPHIVICSVKYSTG